MRALALLLILLLGCNSDTILGPSPPPGVEEPPVLEVPQVVPGPPVDFNNLWGFSAFRMSETSENQQRSDLRFAQNRGYTFARICAETLHWRGVLPTGSDFPVAAEYLRTTLDLIASEGMYALVIPVCTIRDNGSAARREKWTRVVADLLRGRANVFAEAVNEPWHPRSRVSPQELDSLIRILKRASIRTGADQGLHLPNGRYRYTQSSRSDFPSVHVWRNPSPTRAQLGSIVSQNGGWVLLSETVAWGSDSDVSVFGSSLVTSDRQQLTDLVNNCRSTTGCYMVAHTIEGLTGERLTWLPRVR